MVPGITAIAAALLGSVSAVYMVYKKYWKYISILQRIFIKSSYLEILVNHELCKCCYGFFQVCCWRSFNFCCHCCKNKKRNDSQAENFELHHWGNFIKQTISITEPTLDNMINNYVHYKFNHKYYCYKEDTIMCPKSECKHASYTIVERLLKYPVLYLITLDYKKSKEYEEIRKEANKHQDMPYNEPIDYLKFIFRSVIEGAVNRYEIRRAYQNIEVSLKNKFKHLCLILVDFPNDYESFLKPEQEFLLKAVQKASKEYNIQLIYSYK